MMMILKWNQIKVLKKQVFNSEKYIYLFFILELEELISIISNMIYIEVLELKFCKLDYELKKNIIKRSLKDLKDINKNSNKLDADIEMQRIERNGNNDGNGNDEENNDIILNFLIL